MTARTTCFMQALFFSGIFLLLSTGFTNRHTEDAQFICTLTTDKTVYKIGELPQLNVEIINQGNTAVYLPGSLEGSDLKSRMPYCYFTIEKPKPDTLIFLRCGNLNPLREIEVKLIKPKEAFNPYKIFDNYGFFNDLAAIQKETYRNAGVYKIQFHYSTISQDTRAFMGNPGQWDKNSDSTKLKALLEKIPKIDILSNVIEIRVEQ
jgi:hypothetical protein